MSQEFVFDVEEEMNEYFNLHMEDTIIDFKRQAPEWKYKLMKKIKEQAEEFLEYYNHYDEESVDN